MQNPNDIQVGGNHYRGLGVQHWDLVHLLNLDYLTGCASKYLVRFDSKNGIEDLKKAEHYILKLEHLGGVPILRLWQVRFLMTWHQKTVTRFLKVMARLGSLPEALEEQRKDAIMALLRGDLDYALRLTRALQCNYKEFTTHDSGIPDSRYTNQG